MKVPKTKIVGLSKGIIVKIKTSQTHSFNFEKQLLSQKIKAFTYNIIEQLNKLDNMYFKNVTQVTNP